MEASIRRADTLDSTSRKSWFICRHVRSQRHGKDNVILRLTSAVGKMRCGKSNALRWCVWRQERGLRADDRNQEMSEVALMGRSGYLKVGVTVGITFGMFGPPKMMALTETFENSA